MKDTGDIIALNTRVRTHNRDRKMRTGTIVAIRDVDAGFGVITMYRVQFDHCERRWVRRDEVHILSEGVDCADVPSTP